MKYRKNEKGRWEAVTDKGVILPFEDEAEKNAFINLRNEVLMLVGREPEISDTASSVSFGDTLTSVNAKKVKIRIHSGEYAVNGIHLKKKKALA